MKSEMQKKSGIIYGVKLYPAGATTHSASGVTDIQRIYPVLEIMQKLDLPLQVHGEVVDPNIDIFDREAVFIDQVLAPLHADFPELRIIFEHITTRQAVQFVTESGNTLAATVTPQHLIYNRNALFKGGLRPHYYCLPVLKREEHRATLTAAVTGGNPKFFLGTDSAPHSCRDKETSCGCAGIFSAHAAIELYAEVFEAADALHALEGFASRHGAAFYRLPVNSETIQLIKHDWIVPESYSMGNDRLVPLRSGEPVHWYLLDTACSLTSAD